MKRLYEEFFYIPKHKKVHEKVMLARLVAFAMVVIICLVSMSVTAYAYFTYNVTSASNDIEAASFKTNVSVKHAETDADVAVTRVDDITNTAVLTPGNTYNVTIEKLGTASTGFCKISAVGSQINEYHTRQLGVDVNSSVENNTITFKLKVTNPVTVKFDACWGTSAGYHEFVNNGVVKDWYITDGKEITMNILSN